MTLCLHGPKDTLVAVMVINDPVCLLQFHRLSSGRSFGVGDIIDIAPAVDGAQPARHRRTADAAGGLHTSPCARLEARAAAATASRAAPRVL